MKRIAELDGVRGLAILSVMLDHSVGAPVRGGWLGVDVFFVLSGYLITSLLLLERSTNGEICIRDFYGRRMRRLLPALLFMLIFFAAVGLGLGKPWESVATSTLLVLSYAANWASAAGHANWLAPFSHLWTLAVEEQFYILWPVALALMLRRMSVRQCEFILLILIVVLFLYTAVLYHFTRDYMRCFCGSDTRIGQLLVGGLTAFAARRESVRLCFQRNAATPALGLVLIALVVAIATGISPMLFFTGGMLLISLLVAVLLLALTLGRSPLRRPLTFAPLTWVGRISYSLYLWHLPIMLNRFWPPDIAWYYRFAIGGLLALGCATLSYYFIEQPFITVFRRRRMVEEGQASTVLNGDDPLRRRT